MRPDKVSSRDFIFADKFLSILSLCTQFTFRNVSSATNISFSTRFLDNFFLKIQRSENSPAGNGPLIYTILPSIDRDSSLFRPALLNLWDHPALLNGVGSFIGKSVQSTDSWKINRPSST